MFIYEIRNVVNNKVYVGQTSRKRIKKRFNEHKSELDRNVHKNRHLQRSVNKYGIENFKFNILKECKNIDEMNKFEIHYIDEFNSTNPLYGYNKKSGGQENFEFTEEMRNNLSVAKKGFKHSEETRRKMSIAKTGFRHSEETKAKISRNHARNTLGKSPSEETRRKIGLASRGRKASLETRLKLSKAAKGKKLRKRTPEEIEVLSRRMKEKWADPEFYNKMCEIRRNQSTSEVIEKIRQTILKKSDQNMPSPNGKHWPPIISPDGIVYDNIFDMTHFAKQHNLNAGCMRAMCHGEKGSYLGWRLLENTT